MRIPLPPQFTWDTTFALGHEQMDDTHREFVDCVDQMLRVDDKGLPRALEAFAAHAQHHFADEDRWMVQSAYENARCHIDEHAAVLKSVDEVRAALARGRCDVARSFANALADWFPEHARVMDHGLALWLAKQRLGGSPVVIRPRPAVAA
jgi:hemerythrin